MMTILKYKRNIIFIILSDKTTRRPPQSREAIPLNTSVEGLVMVSM
jgi:hypothetical protein